MRAIGTTTALFMMGAGLALATSDTLERGPEERLAGTLEEARGSMELEAAAVRVDVGGEVLHSDAFGSAQDGRAEADLDTAFQAGDLARVWLTVLALEQHGKGELALDAALHELVPGLVAEDSPLHLAHLLRGTSGLADITDFLGEEALRGGSYASVLEPARVQPLVTEPGECVAPTPTETLLLAAVLEARTGSGAAELLQSRLFERLELASSGYRAPGTLPVEAGAGEGVGARPALHAPSLFTSASDVARFGRALLDRELLQSEDLEALLEPTRLRDGSLAPSGLGVELTRAGAAEALLFGGGGAALVYVPAHDLIVSAVGRGERARMDRLALRLASAAIEVPEVELVDLYLSRADMLPYLGTYSVGCNTLVILPGEGRLVLSRADEGEDTLLYQGGQRFVLAEDTEVSVTFELEGARAIAFVLDVHGRQTRATRFE